VDAPDKPGHDGWDTREGSPGMTTSFQKPFTA